MNELLENFRNTFLSSILKFLWGQWSALGIAGYGRTRNDIVIDPDVLLLFSLSAARFDARLFDEILDWLLKNGNYINLQRIKNFITTYDFDAKAEVSSVASWLVKNSSYLTKWKSLTELYHTEPPKPLFRLPNGATLPHAQKTSAEFKEHGLLRSEIQVRNYSKLFPPYGNQTLLLRLRALIGINAKCELLTLLSSVPEVHPSKAAVATGYYLKTVQSALIELTHSGEVHISSSKREKYYSLREGSIKKYLCDTTQPLWVNWAPLFYIWEKIILLLFSDSIHEFDHILIESQLKRLVKTFYFSAREAGAARLFSETLDSSNVHYFEFFFRDINNLDGKE